MASNVGLPGLQFDRNRHGRPRWYYVHKRRKKRLQDVEGEPPLEITHDVRAAYDAANAFHATVESGSTFMASS